MKNLYFADYEKLKHHINNVLAKALPISDRKLLNELSIAVTVTTSSYICFDCDSKQDSHLLNLLGIKPTAYTRGVNDYEPVTPKVVSNVVFTKMPSTDDSYYVDTVALYSRFDLFAKLFLYGNLREDGAKPNSFRFTLSPCFDKDTFEEYVQTFALLK